MKTFIIIFATLFSGSIAFANGGGNGPISTTTASCSGAVYTAQVPQDTTRMQVNPTPGTTPSTTPGVPSTTPNTTPGNTPSTTPGIPGTTPVNPGQPSNTPSTPGTTPTTPGSTPAPPNTPNTPGSNTPGVVPPRF